MADGGEFLLAGVIAGALFKAKMEGSFMIRTVEPVLDADGNARALVKVEMPSGTYFVNIAEYDAHLDAPSIQEDP